jgi:hypothetical protein
VSPRSRWASIGIGAAVALLVALIIVLGGGDEGGGSSDGESGGGDSGGSMATTRIVVTVDPDGTGGDPPLRRELVCDPGDDNPACALAARLSPAQLDPVPPDALCTKIYGGPQVATIEGSLEGERVDARLTRADGCEIERFDHVTPLLLELFPESEPLARQPARQG